MSSNEITYTADSIGDSIRYIFTGSQRQPTLLEVNNYCVRNRLEIGFCVVLVRDPEEWVPPEDAKSVELLNINCNEDKCPICGRERDLWKDNCPTCGTPWEVANDRRWEDDDQ